ncbi:MAG: hypothetical protein JWQ74_3572 [Marmoricola sp.]|nr:hypothetical protein [Marmoricola sp.]
MTQRNNSTFGGMIDMGFDIMVNCSSTACERSKRLDLEEMAIKYGRDHGALHDDLIKLPWRCELCGGHKVSFTVLPAGKEYDPARQAMAKIRDVDPK